MLTNIVSWKTYASEDSLRDTGEYFIYEQNTYELIRYWLITENIILPLYLDVRGGTNNISVWKIVK